MSRKDKRAAERAAYLAYYQAQVAPTQFVPPVIAQAQLAPPRSKKIKVKRGQRLCAVCGDINKPKVKTETFRGRPRKKVSGWGALATGGLSVIGDLAAPRRQGPVTGRQRTAYCRSCGAASPG
jgi:hypothetical protein